MYFYTKILGWTCMNNIILRNAFMCLLCLQSPCIEHQTTELFYVLNTSFAPLSSYVIELDRSFLKICWV